MQTLIAGRGSGFALIISQLFLTQNDINHGEICLGRLLIH